jgi:hypothetical protein
VRRVSLHLPVQHSRGVTAPQRLRIGAQPARPGLVNFFTADVEAGLSAFVSFCLAYLGWSKGSIALP